MELLKTFTDESNAAIDAGRFKVGFAPIRAAIEKLKKYNAPMYWDTLYSCLDGRSILDAYSEKWAKENYENWEDVETRNRIKHRFRYLSNPNGGSSFSKEFIKLHDDGSFELDNEKIDKHFRDEYTFTFSNKQLKGMQQIIDGMQQLGVYPSVIKELFIGKGKDCKPNYVRLLNFMKRHGIKGEK